MMNKVLLIKTLGWLGAACLVIAPPIIDMNIGKLLAISGLALLTTQAVNSKLYNLVCLNVLGIAGYLYAYM